MRIRILSSLIALALTACGTDLSEEQGHDESTDVASEVQGSISADDGREIMRSAFRKVAGVTDQAKRNEIIGNAFREAGLKMAPVDVIGVLVEFMPYAQPEVLEPSTRAGVWKRAQPSDRRVLHTFLSLYAMKFRDSAEENNQTNYAKHSELVRRFLPTAITLIKRAEPQLTTDQDVLRSLVEICYPLSISGKEFVAALKKAGLATTPIGPGLWGGSALDSMGLDATLGGQSSSVPAVMPLQDLASDSSFEARVLETVARSFVTFRSPWTSLETSTMTIGDRLNSVAKATGREPEVALRVLNRVLTAEEFKAMQALREKRRF